MSVQKIYLSSKNLKKEHELKGSANPNDDHHRRRDGIHLRLNFAMVLTGRHEIDHHFDIIDVFNGIDSTRAAIYSISHGIIIAHLFMAIRFSPRSATFGYLETSPVALPEAVLSKPR